MCGSETCWSADMGVHNLSFLLPKSLDLVRNNKNVAAKNIHLLFSYTFCFLLLSIFIWQTSSWPSAEPGQPQAWPSPLSRLHRRRVACPQWAAMSQLPASLPTSLPPKCHPTWGTAPPPRPMWPEPRGSRPVAVRSLPTAVTSPPHSPSRAWRPTVTPSTCSPRQRCEDQRVCEEGEERGLYAAALLPSSSLWRTQAPRTHTCPPPPPPHEDESECEL